MKNNQVYLDPLDLEKTMQQLQRFYRLDEETLGTLRRIVEKYPRPVIVYVDEANAPLYADSVLDDLFTFNTETGELILFSSDPMTFIDGLIEMWMFVRGFKTLMGNPDYWKVEFAIGCWKPIKNAIKRSLGIPVNNQITGIVGLPPQPDKALIEDEYPFKTLVASLTTISFAQMVRLAGRNEIRVHFPQGTDPKVIDVYFSIRRAIQIVTIGLGVDDTERFNERLKEKIQHIEERFSPSELPVPKEWQANSNGMEAASDSADSNQDDDSDMGNEVGLLLGPDSDESPLGRLLSEWEDDEPDDSIEAVDRRLEQGPFGNFIETLFDE